MFFHQKINLIMLLVVWNLAAQPNFCSHSPVFVQTINFNQLNTSIVDNLYGLQSLSNFHINCNMEILNSATYLLENQNSCFMNDFRLSLLGPTANNWHPGIGFDIGYLYLSRDIFNQIPASNQHGILFGGNWYFPLDILSNGYVVAKLAYVKRINSNDMVICNCFAHWNLTNKLGFHVGGDIYTKIGGYKYSGFIAGFSFQLPKNYNPIERK